jgi:glycosyltransferase involved in cell wall biosynthesis
MNPIKSIIRAAVRRPDEPLNILTYSAHAPVESELAQTNANFTALWSEGLKTWDLSQRPLPPNYKVVDIKNDIRNIPDGNYDLILGHNMMAHGQIAQQVSRVLHIPWVQLEHCCRVVDENGYRFYRSLKPNVRVFITEFSRDQWSFSEGEAEVIYHGIDSDTFKPGVYPRDNLVLSVANDFKNRNQLLGWDYWVNCTQGLPTLLVGDTPGYSKPASSLDELVGFYQKSSVYMCPALHSPLPHTILEAASAGCGIVAAATCAIPEVFTHKENAYLYNPNEPQTARKYLGLLLGNPSEARRIGENARKLILDRFTMDRYINQWNDMFRRVASLPFTGV